MKKRIGIVMYQTSNSKGQELVAQRMVSEFNRLGQRADLITSVFHDGKEVVPPETLARRGYAFADDEVLKIPVIRVESYMAKWPPRRIVFRDFVHTLETLVDELGINVLITHSTLWNGPEDVAKFIVWRRGMRNIGGYQDPIVFCHMSHFQEPSSLRYLPTELAFRTAWNKMSLSKIMEIANLILVVTPFEKKSKIKMGGKPEKIFLFPGGVDEELFLKHASEDPSEFPKRLGLNTGTKIISYIGTIEERKNPAAVLKIAERLKDKNNIHFILAGRGESTYAEGVEKIARSLPNVSYLGELADSDKVRLIKASHINIIMSRLEALGIVQLEYMYCGLPVVSSATGGQSWLIQDGVEGLHTKGPDDIVGAANAIMKMVEDEALYKQLSMGARKKAIRFTTGKLVAELDEAINAELVKESGLVGIPLDVQSTLVQPEQAIKTWKSGTYGIVATNKRIFITHGLISKKLTELRYSDIKIIEHARRYPWRTVVTGFIISAFLLVTPALRSILSRAFLEQVDAWIRVIDSITPDWFTANLTFQFLLPLIPLLISLIIFSISARTGFQLYCQGTKPVYLPRRFKKAIAFIREKIDTASL